MSKILLESIFTFLHFSTSKVQMSRNFSMSFKAVSGTVLSFAITFTLIIWGVMWCSGMRMFRYGGVLHLGTLLGTNAAGCWLVLVPICWTGNYLQLSFLRILLILLLIAIGIKVFSCLCCYVCGSGPTLGANIMSLTSSLAATASTNIRNTALRIVHTDLLYIFTKVHQQ